MESIDPLVRLPASCLVYLIEATTEVALTCERNWGRHADVTAVRTDAEGDISLDWEIGERRITLTLPSGDDRYYVQAAGPGADALQERMGCPLDTGAMLTDEQMTMAMEWLLNDDRRAD